MAQIDEKANWYSSVLGDYCVRKDTSPDYVVTDELVRHVDRLKAHNIYLCKRNEELRDMASKNYEDRTEKLQIALWALVIVIPVASLLL